MKLFKSLRKKLTKSGFKAGFTLIEGILVAIILGILASTAVSVAYNARATATEAVVKSIVSDVNSAIQRNLLAEGSAQFEFAESKITEGDNVADALKNIILQFSCITLTTGDYDEGTTANPSYGWTYTAPTGSATPLFTRDSCIKMVTILDKHFDKAGLSAESATVLADNQIGVTIHVAGTGESWGTTEFYVTNADDDAIVGGQASE